jgi:hypothetical protein
VLLEEPPPVTAGLPASDEAGAAPEPAGRLVTRPLGNVGSNLSSLAGAVWLARSLGRTLVVDWREQPQLRDQAANYFTEFFETPARLLDVRVAYAPAVDVGTAGSPSAGSRWIGLEEAYAIRVGSAGADGSDLVLQTYHGLDRIHPGPEPERFRLLRSLYREIRPRPRIADEVDAWWRESCDGSFVVGLNVRTGNGHWYGPGMPYADRVNIGIFENRRRFLRILERACRARASGLPKPLRSEFKVFYATDSEWMSELLGSLPGAVTRRRIFPPPGSGDGLFDRPGHADREAVADTLCDMFLLARCDGLVYNTSLFNQYARVMTGWFGGNHAHIELLYPEKRAQLALASARRRLR